MLTPTTQQVHDEGADDFVMVELTAAGLTQWERWMTEHRSWMAQHTSRRSTPTAVDLNGNR